MSVKWDELFSERALRMKSSAIRELLKLTEQPDFISFAGGLPAPEVFPVEAIERATVTVMREHGAQALQYGLTEGYTPLRELIATRLNHDGMKVTSENIMITTGSQQALDLLGKIFINHDDFILTESPTYLGALQAWNSYQAAYLTIPTDDDGMITDGLEQLLQNHPKFIYALPNFQNPGGFTMNGERRNELVRLSAKYNVPIVEDDPYGELRYEGEPLPSLLALSATFYSGSNYYTGNVIRLNTFSKILAPGLRLGWVVAAPEVIFKLAQAKQGADLHTSSLNQFLAYELLQSGFLDQHIHIIRQTYRERRDVMLQSLQDFFPEGVRWTKPKGGMFLWVRLPEGMDSSELLKIAIERKFAFVPGRSFFPNGGGENTMRLNFSNSTPQKIREGIRLLGELLKEHISQPIPSVVS
ncbi:PLP-dependent aminotransferase family protein [Candidatus Chlorohelix sp.]|uniref:aminotransferase-like domain-containing protein n=1 Tax=Candidatus Chlorohelix sp. TaxID=3139201 RepID=UPI003033CA41